MVQTETLSEEIIGWAKRAALAEGATQLTVLHLLCGVRAVCEDPQKLERIRSSLGLRPSQTPVWPDEVLKLHQKAKQQPPTSNRMQLDLPVQRAVAAATAEDPSLPAARLVAHLLQQRSAPAVAQFLALNNLVATPAAVSPGLEGMEQARAHAQALEQRLAAEVLGQDAAVSMLVSAYWDACLGQQPDGPKGIFTFLGPPGVGKTLLAERFAAALQDLEGGAVGFRRFDMGSFAGYQNFEQLFGTESYYKNGQPGTLSGFVAEYPRAVILFDELEKAHETVLTALLAVLDKGEVDDKNLKKKVSFRECWVIFTTNLGRELFESENVSGILGPSAATRAFVFDILASARRRGDVGDKGTVPALPSELVSRLAKGGAVLFRKLPTSAQVRLIRRSLDRATAATRAASKRPTPEILPDDRALLVFLLSLLPNLDARQVVARTSSWAVQLQRDAYESCRTGLLGRGSEKFDLRVECGDQAKRYLDEKFAALKISVLVVDDDEYVAKGVEPVAARFQGKVSRADSLETAVENAHRAEADVVFLDLSIGEGPSSAKVETALGILKALRGQFPELPVWLFSENPQSRANFGAVVPRILRDGGARGYIPCEFMKDKGLLGEDFLARAEHVVEEVAFDKLVRQMQRSHLTVAFDTEYALVDGGASGTVITATLTRLQGTLVVSAADQRGAIRFAGIPRERLSSVVGLSRAKRRLEQVVKWLRDPAALSRFGIAPPRGFLLAGPPGTGKTLLARAVAGEAGLPFLGLSAGELQSKWTGEAEERVRDLFQLAREYAPSIIFIDEIDAIGRARGETGVGYGSLLNELLAAMDGFNVGSRPIFVLAATNHPELLDSALVRPGRFDETIPIDLPNAAAREEFFRIRLRSLGNVGDVDLKRLVPPSAGLSPAELDRVVREAAYAVAAEGHDRVTEADLLVSLRHVRFGAAQEGIKVKPEERKIVAHHEAGHAIAQLRLFPELPVDYLTIVPTEGGALGLMSRLGDEAGHLSTREAIENRLTVTLAGREAERITAGVDAQVTSGAADDIARANGLAWHAVAHWGLDAEIGPLSITGLPREASGDLSARAVERVGVWLADAAKRANELLRQNKESFEKLSELLLERESLDSEDINQLFNDGGSKH